MIMVLRGHKSWVMCCCFSPADETLLASGSRDGSVRFWRVETGDCVRRLKPERAGLTTSKKEVLCCCFHPGGDLLCTGGEEKTLRLWRVHDGACVRILQGHKGTVQGCAFQGSAGRLLASVEGNTMFGSENTLRVWDLAGNIHFIYVCRTVLCMRVGCFGCVARALSMVSVYL
jgi:WD40 repeat protein